MRVQVHVGRCARAVGSALMRPALSSLLTAAACWHAPRFRLHACASSWDPETLEAVVRELNTVPVFALRLIAENTLYGAAPGCSTMYSQLPDAHRVLGQLSETYPESQLEVLPLGLGTTMRQAGLLGDELRAQEENGGYFGEEAPPRATIVASPLELRKARSASADYQRHVVRGLDVPVFHIGELEWQNDPGGSGESGGSEMLWPFLFRAADVEALWAEVGGDDQEMPPLQVTDLADVVERLRTHTLGQPGSRPLLCAPLDAVEFLRANDLQAVRDSDAALRDASENAAPRELF